MNDTRVQFPPNAELYLQESWFVETRHPIVLEYANQFIRPEQDPVENAVQLFYAVRDGFRYNPYNVEYEAGQFKTSHILQREYKRGGHCIDKANILTACARIAGIPTRFRFFNVKNHIGTEKLEKKLGTDILVFHGCVEMWLRGKWVKAVPAFNIELCEYLGVSPLEFNGEEDAMFQEFDPNMGKFMDYVHDYGAFHDIPFDLMVGEWRRYYPRLSKAGRI